MTEERKETEAQSGTIGSLLPLDTYVAVREEKNVLCGSFKRCDIEPFSHSEVTVCLERKN